MAGNHVTRALHQPHNGGSATEHTRGYRCPSHVHFAPLGLLILTCFLALAASCTRLLARRVPPRMPAVFAGYETLFPGSQVDFANLTANGFSCLDVPPKVPVGFTTECTTTSAVGPILALTLDIKADFVKRLHAMLRHGSLTVGDCSRQWGRPDIRIIGHWVTLVWKEQHISGASWSDTGLFSYFQSVLQLSFASGSLEDE